MKTKRIILLPAVLLLLLSLLACGSREPEIISENDTNAGREEEIVLNITSMYGDDDVFADAYRQLLREFEEENPGVRVKDNSATATEEWKLKIASDFAVGDEADVVGFFTDANADNLLASEKFVSIREIREKYPSFARDTKPAALAQAAAPDGTEYAVPTLGYWEGLYCNKDLFDQYGLKLPNTWDNLMAAIEVFKENGIVPITVSLSEQPHYLLEFLIMYSSGKEIYESVPENVPEEWVKGVECLKTLYDLGAFSEDATAISYSDAKELFIRKKAAMIVDGSWFLGAIGDQTRTVVCDFPIPPGGRAWIKTILSGFSSGFYITRKAFDDEKRQELAVKLVEKLTGKEGVELFWKAGGYVQATAVELDEPEGLTPLEASAIKYVNMAKVQCAPTDSRISGAPWAAFISDITGIAKGSLDARVCLEQMLEAQHKLKSR